MTKAMLRNEADGKTSTLTASTTIGGNTVTVSETVTWGGTQGGGTGSATLTISARRGQQQIAPEGIAFFAEVSGFDAQKPTDGSVYDPTMHDISYTWNFGDPGQFTAPENMLPEWRDANKGYGPFPAHCFTKPGTYTVTCIASERSSGKTATASIQVTVQDPEAVFTPATTIVCSTSSTWTGAPAHDVGNRYTDLPSAIQRLAAMKSTGLDARVLFRGGEVFQSGGSLIVNQAIRNVYFSSYGSGRATIRPGGVNAIFMITKAMIVSGASISRLHFQGGWDSTTESYLPGYPTGNIKAIDTESGFCTAYDCTASGLYTAFANGKSPGLTAIYANCQATNWEDYGAFVEGENEAVATDPLTSYVAHIGCRYAQEKNALQGANGKSTTDRGNRHGAFRCHAAGYVYVDALDGFSRNGWTAPVGGVPVDQNIIRDHRNDPKSRGFFSRIMGEGGWGAFTTGSATGSGHEPCNAVLEKFYFLGSARQVVSVGGSSPALTVRNGIVHFPNVGTGADVPAKGMSFMDSYAVEYLPSCSSEPVHVYNVTVVNERDATQQARNNQNSTAWDAVLSQTKAPGLMDEGKMRVENIVVHRPNFPGGFVGDGPLNSARLGFVPRYLGYRWKSHGALPDKLTMDTSFATPANPWSLWRPQAGSPAIGSAAGLVAYDDLLGNVRPPQASRGAIEPA